MPFWSVSLICLVLSFTAGEALAMDVSGGLSVSAVDMAGTNSYRTSFTGGESLLKWPINEKMVGADLLISTNRSSEVELGILARPWGSSNGKMKDYDYIDESYYVGRTPHQGTDIYSESSLDSRALIFDALARVFPLQRKYFSAGFSAGYEYQEFDYRAYDTRQTGYDTWSDHTNSVSGLVSIYSLEYNAYSLGVSLRSSLDDAMIFTADASVLPYVTATDEDDHVRRCRRSLSRTRGYGFRTDLSGLFKVYGRWYLSSRLTLKTIRTKGHQDQYWYGDDPATSHFDDTGQSLPGLGVKINQDILGVSIGAFYRF